MLISFFTCPAAKSLEPHGPRAPLIPASARPVQKGHFRERMAFPTRHSATSRFLHIIIRSLSADSRDSRGS